MDEDERWLRASFAAARAAVAGGDQPYGAVLVGASGRLLAEAGNSIASGADCTAHAELNLIRGLGARPAAGLAGATLYASTEPCAMCAAAIHWSRIGRVVYALSEDDLYAIVGFAPDQLRLPCREVFAHSGRPVQVDDAGAALAAEARAVHENFWS